MKENRLYYFSVEGETEKWYLEWLQKTINSEPASKYMVKFDVKIQKDPLGRAKGLTALGRTEIVHVFDRESEDEVHRNQFQTTLDRMKMAQNIGKKISYKLGYSNYTFELWIILHKADCNGSLANRYQYLAPINRVYNEDFENLDQYKHEDNFKRILSKLEFGNVQDAVQRAKLIMERNKDAGYVLQQYKGYRYYIENPSLSLGEQNVLALGLIKVGL